MQMIRCVLAALAAALMATAPGALAQDDAQSAHLEDRDDGTTLHKPSGAVCPAKVGEVGLIEVLSFDRGDTHLGIGCLYQGGGPAEGSVYIFRADEEELAGSGTSAERWNAAMRRSIAQYGGLPNPLDGLGDDADAGLFGTVLETQGQGGIPVMRGLWFVDGAVWVVRGEASFVPVDAGMDMAKAVRATVVDVSKAAS